MSLETHHPPCDLLRPAPLEGLSVTVVGAADQEPHIQYHTDHKGNQEQHSQSVHVEDEVCQCGGVGV